MEMFSKELYELDRNTVQYMIDEMQDTIDAQKDELDKQKNELDEQKNELDKQKNELDKQKNELDRKNQTIEELQRRNDESIVSAINILRSLNIPDEEIIPRVCEQYRVSREQLY